MNPDTSGGWREESREYVAATPEKQNEMAGSILERRLKKLIDVEMRAKNAVDKAVISPIEAAGTSIKDKATEIKDRAVAAKERAAEAIRNNAERMQDSIDRARERFTNRVDAIRDSATARAKALEDRAINLGVDFGGQLVTKMAEVAAMPVKLEMMAVEGAESKIEKLHNKRINNLMKDYGYDKETATTKADELASVSLGMGGGEGPEKGAFNWLKPKQMHEKIADQRRVVAEHTQKSADIIKKVYGPASSALGWLESQRR